MSTSEFSFPPQYSINYSNQQHLRDALYSTLNEFVGWDYNKVGQPVFQLLYSYYDIDNKLRREQ